MTEEKKLGKITEVHCGIGGYNDAMVGYNFTLQGKDWGVCTPWNGHWCTQRSPNAVWVEEDRLRDLGKAFMDLAQLLEKADKLDVKDLVGVPVEATFEGMTLKSWRILEEVL